jgi:NitT/TauT family transport system substrate-binding protein
VEATTRKSWARRPARWLTLGAAALAVAGTAAGCSSSASAGAGSTGGNKSVTVVWGNTTTYYTWLPYYIAEGLGYFKDLQSQGITVKEVDFQNGADEAKALVSGDLDISNQMFNEVAIPITEGAPVSFVAAYWNGGVTSMIAAAKYSATTLPALRKELGRPILVGVSALGAGTDTFARAQLMAQGLKPSDYKIVPLGSVDSYYPGLQSGKVDAVEASEPQAQQLINQGIGRILVNDWNPAEVQQIWGDYTANGIAATDKFMQSDPAALKAVVGAIVKAEEWIQQHKNDPSAILAELPEQAQKTTTAATNAQVWKRISAAASTNGCVQSGTGQGSEKALKATGLMESSVPDNFDWSKNISTAYLPAPCS